MLMICAAVEHILCLFCVCVYDEYSGRPLEQSSGRPLLNYVYDKKDVEYKFQTALIAEPLVPAAGPARCG